MGMLSKQDQKIFDKEADAKQKRQEEEAAHWSQQAHPFGHFHHPAQFAPPPPGFPMVPLPPPPMFPGMPTVLLTPAPGFMPPPPVPMGQPSWRKGGDRRGNNRSWNSSGRSRKSWRDETSSWNDRETDTGTSRPHSSRSKRRYEKEEHFSSIVTEEETAKRARRAERFAGTSSVAGGDGSSTRIQKDEPTITSIHNPFDAEKEEPTRTSIQNPFSSQKDEPTRTSIQHASATATTMEQKDEPTITSIPEEPTREEPTQDLPLSSVAGDSGA